jgi:hypothetical protein
MTVEPNLCQTCRNKEICKYTDAYNLAFRQAGEVTVGSPLITLAVRCSSFVSDPTPPIISYRI